MPLGVVSLAEHFGGKDVTPQSYAGMVEEVARHVAPFAAEHGGDLRDMHLLGTSGTVTTLAGVHLNLPRYDRRRIDGVWMSDADLTATIARLLGMSYQRARHQQLHQRRARRSGAGGLRHPRCDPQRVPAAAAAGRRPRPARGHAGRNDARGRRLARRMPDRRGGRDDVHRALADMAKDTTGRLHVTVKSAGKRKLSSKLWLERQLNDPYVAQAKRDGCARARPTS